MKKKALSKFLILCMAGITISGCGKPDADAPVTADAQQIVSEEETIAENGSSEEEPKAMSDAFVKCVEDAGLWVSLSDKYNDYISITALSSDYDAMTWGISEESEEIVYGGSSESLGFGEPGEYKITGYMATITSFAGTALYDGITDDTEVISMYHELGSDETDKDIKEFPYVASYNAEECYHKVINTEDGIYVEDLSRGAHNLTYTVVKNNMIITVYGSYDNKDDIEALVASIRAITAEPDEIARTGFTEEG